MRSQKEKLWFFFCSPSLSHCFFFCAFVVYSICLSSDPKRCCCWAWISAHSSFISKVAAIATNGDDFAANASACSIAQQCMPFVCARWPRMMRRWNWETSVQRVLVKINHNVVYSMCSLQLHTMRSESSNTVRGLKQELNRLNL